MLNHIEGLVGSPDVIYHETAVASGNVDFSADTVHLIAPTASGKSAYFEHLVNGAKSGLYVLFVPRLSLIRQMVSDMRQNTNAQVFHFEDDRAEFKQSVASTNMEKLVLVTTTNSLWHFEADIQFWIETGRSINAISLEEYAQGAGMWMKMKENKAVRNFRVLQQLIAVSDKVIVPDGTEAEFVKSWVEGLRPESNSTVISIEPIHTKAPIQAYYGKESETLAYVRNRIIQQIGRIAVGFDTAKQLNMILKEIRTYNAENPDNQIPYVVSVAPDNKRVALNDLEMSNMAEFEADVNGQAPKYEVYLYTTKLGTGVSITSVEVETRIVIAGNTTSPADHVQKINRFRRHKENIVLFSGRDNEGALTNAMNENAYIEYGAAEFRSTFGLDASETKVQLDKHIFAYHEWVGQLKSGGMNTLLDMLERDGMARPYEVLPITGIEPLETAVGKLTDEQIESLALVMKELGAIPPRLKDRKPANDTSENTAEEIEIRKLYGLLFMRFSPNLVKHNLVQCITEFGKRVNDGSSLFVGEVLMGIRKGYADTIKEKRLIELTANKEDAQLTIHARVLAGQEVLKALSPLELKVRDTVYVMTPEQWRERGQVFLDWITANPKTYNRAVGDKRNYLSEIIARHPESRSKQAYTALKAIATVNGIVVESQRIGGANSREYVPALVGLDRRWIMLNGRVLGKAATLTALQEGRTPDDALIPAIELDWCKLADDLWLQIEEIKGLVDRKSVERFDIYQAWLKTGATEKKARAKALSEIWPVEARELLNW